jgi:prepilin-type N-terminal cleavage/methylation domain-containing protein
MRRRAAKGFTLVELAVVMAIVGLLLGGMMYSLRAVTEQRGWEDTQRRLDYARELLLSFAVVNGRLPCPASSLGGDEAFASGTAAAGGTCTTSYPTASAGYLPAKAIGFQPVSSSGAALDGWGNPIRYAVSVTTWSTAGYFTKKHVATDTTLAWSVSTTPADLVVCSAAPSPVTATSCSANTSVVNANTVVAIVFSTGKNSATGGTGTNEARNLDGNALFVSRTPDPSDAAGGEFDDVLAWIPIGQLYGRLISAGVLP